MLEGKFHPIIPTVPVGGLLCVDVITNNTVGNKEQWEHKEILQHLWFSGGMQPPEK